MNVLCLSLQRSAQGDAKHRGSVFGVCKIGELTSQEIAAWRMELSPGYRFEPTQALRQVLHRAVACGMTDSNPAKVGVVNPLQRRKEQPRSDRGRSSRRSWGLHPGGQPNFRRQKRACEQYRGTTQPSRWSRGCGPTRPVRCSRSASEVHERTRRQPEIYIMNADGSNQTNVSHDPVEDTSPSWVPARR
jgi:hypothetical protein